MIASHRSDYNADIDDREKTSTKPELICKAWVAGFTVDLVEANWCYPTDQRALAGVRMESRGPKTAPWRPPASKLPTAKSCVFCGRVRK